jgi:hypothetical protein
MTDGDLNDALKRAGGAAEPDPALLARVAQQMGESLEPVGALPHPLALTTAAAAVCLGVAAAGAVALGLNGAERMTAAQALAAYPVLMFLILATAFVCVSESIPGSRRWIRPAWLLAASCIALAAVFAALFRDPGAERFVAHGIPCLKAGLATAVPAALLTWLALRRGYAVDRTGSATVRGVLAGLAGIVLLELHCPNFETAHVLTWHLAVVPVSAGAAVLLGRLRR